MTRLLLAWRAGDADAPERLFPLVYAELKRVARRKLAAEHPGHTLTPTGLVHEAYLVLVDQHRAQWVDRAHFLAVAARVMRRILLESARRRRATKRGGALERVTFDGELPVPIEGRAELLLALDDALGRLAEIDERRSRVVECRFFGGLTERETAAALGVTERTVQRDWAIAKAWLYQALTD